ncbi:MAG: DUF983 domain-containing protein [Saprospiraceae bacterium]|nr:DUF983 domain-containing protein [Saprospiraceae bacterium]
MSIFGKGSKLYSIFAFKCPKCHEGDLYETGSFSFDKPFEMPERCPNCKQSYMPEPGFYYGSMFLSYIFSAFFSLFFVMFFHWVLGWSIGASFGLLIGVGLVFFVWFFRFARALWINLNVHYDSTKSLKSNTR